MFERINDFKVDKYINLGSKQQKEFFAIFHCFFISDFNDILKRTNKIAQNPFEEMEVIRSTAERLANIVEDFDDSIDHILSDSLYSRSIDMVSAYLLIFCRYDFPLLINDFRKRFDKMSYDEFKIFEVSQIEERIRQQIFNNIFVFYESVDRDYWQPEIDPIKSHSKGPLASQYAKSFTKIIDTFSIDDRNLHTYLFKLYKNYKLGDNSHKEYFLFGLLFILDYTGTKNIEAALNRKFTGGFPPAYRDMFEEELFIKKIRDWDNDSSIRDEFITFERWDNIMKSLVLLHLQLNIISELKNTFKYSNIFHSHISASTPRELVTKYSLKVLNHRYSMSIKILSRYLRSMCIPNETAKLSDYIDEEGLFKVGSISAALKTMIKKEELFNPSPFFDEIYD